MLLPHRDVLGLDIKQNMWNPELNGHTIIADLRNTKELSILPPDSDIVIHVAANASVYELNHQYR